MKNICDWNNCKKIGAYKAPIEKDNSKKYRLLCLEHVREFNKNWNYFSDMDDNQISEFNSIINPSNFADSIWNYLIQDIYKVYILLGIIKQRESNLSPKHQISIFGAC